MSRWLKLSLLVGVVSLGFATTSCWAKGTPMNTDSDEESHDQSWSREQRTNTKADARAIAQQKAEARAEQRMDRMASANWYGISNSRPTGSSTPFTSRYGSLWEMPGGRPYSWNPPYSRPNYVFFW